ncbi:hypothetical protein [Cellulophaga omnivescoria]|uniref:hypothetical protein n=1 Tax=Cellulophaga omnivescoria TaxID=1888890 RepID=UPI0022F0802E|nr:hypothetical protein [Cellulophaga omnivescoria]WBU87906.1 hypothetical protein PBN93_08470 [Cellulophaga omnivescoria]
MGLFAKLFKKKKEVEIEKTSVNKNAVEKNKQIIEPQINSDLGHLKNVLPKLKFGWEFESKKTTINGEVIEIPKGELPASTRIAQTSLSVILMKDENQIVQWIKIQDLNDVEINKALETSFKNLLDQYSEISIGGIDTKSSEIGKVGMIINASMYSGSLILLEQIWEQIFQFIGSEEINFIVPNSRLVIFCDSKDLKGNGYLYGNAKHHFNNSYDAISEFVYFKKKGKSIIELKDEELEYDV